MTPRLFIASLRSVRDTVKDIVNQANQAGLDRRTTLEWKDSMYETFSLTDYDEAYHHVFGHPGALHYLSTRLDTILIVISDRTHGPTAESLIDPQSIRRDMNERPQRFKWECLLLDAVDKIGEFGTHPMLNAALSSWKASLRRIFGLWADPSDERERSYLTPRIKSSQDVNSLVASIRHFKQEMAANQENWTEWEQQIEHSLESDHHHQVWLPTIFVHSSPQLWLQSLEASHHPSGHPQLHHALPLRPPPSQMSLRKSRIYRIATRDQSFI
ncbi:uncharacterized protein JCM6883_004798 [Sporobolomyces salmoneus]|uniref:uncharacterized protein n=1 Tax=Sporobolomyces salmoneus TaxID=183962 RepID=UPI003177071F